MPVQIIESQIREFFCFEVYSEFDLGVAQAAVELDWVPLTAF
jgi:hypothetical protein